MTRKAVTPGLRGKGKVHSFKAPIRGWVTNEQLSDAKPGAAAILENWFPLKYSIRMRGGLDKEATVTTDGAFEPSAFEETAFLVDDDSETIVTAFMAYRAAGTEKLFAADATQVFDVTPPVVDPDAPVVAEFGGMSGGEWSHVNFATSGGNFLVMVNGEDERRVYDGSAWATTPTITGGSGTNGDTYSHVWVYKNRLFFIVGGTLKFEYLPVDTLGGAIAAFNLGAVFHRGGALVCGGTWSIDAGDGLDDVCVFITDQGEMAVYQGSNPASGTDWAIVGRYEVGIPLGNQAMLRAGGDLMIATTDGLVAVSSAVQKDRAALSLTAVSFPIEPDWRAYAENRRERSWQITRWNNRGMALVSFPNDTGQDVECLALNLQTGAWAKYTGWNVTASIEFREQLYVGLNSGFICAAEVTGTDLGEPYYGAYLGLHEPLGNVAEEKAALMARGTFRARAPFNVNIFVSSNYDRTLRDYPNAPTEPASAIWDGITTLWDSAVWDSDTAEVVRTGWMSVAGVGFVLSPIAQVTANSTAFPVIELISVDLLYEDGGTVV
jgi:hypothetical protein